MSLESLAELRERARTVAASDFVHFCPEPIFIVFPHQSDDDSASFQTLKGGRPTTGAPAFGVAHIRKRPNANAFSMMITIGRAPNNDIQLRANGVSKFHAYIQVGKDGTVTLTDAGSSYGTTVAGRRLQPRVERATLRTGDEVRVGDGVRMVFVGREDAHRYLSETTFTATGAGPPG